MTTLRRQLYSGALGAALVLLLLVVASLDGMLMNPDEPEVTRLINVQMYEEPPPPPPPVSRSTETTGGAPSLSPQQQVGQSGGVELDIMDLKADVKLAAGISGDFGNGFGGLAGFGGSGDGLGDSMFVTDLSGLDSQPIVMYAPLVDHRKFFEETGYTEFSVRFHIAVDATGQTTPIGIIDNPLPQLQGDLLNYAAQVRFTPPTRAGIPVRTEYLWPVHFRMSDEALEQRAQSLRRR